MFVPPEPDAPDRVHELEAAAGPEWRRAHLALAEATRLFVVGYSLPPSNLVVGLLLQQSCPSDAEITVVDPGPTVRDRVARLLHAAGGRGTVRWLADVRALAEELPPTVARPPVLLRE